VFYGDIIVGLFGLAATSRDKRKYWGQHLWSRGYFCAVLVRVDAEIMIVKMINTGTEIYPTLAYIGSSSKITVYYVTDIFDDYDFPVEKHWCFIA
jgi:hypothetical protein